MKYSIIIPVYNVEKYIRKCLNSVLNQSYNNFEVIIVIDGSLDNSEDIIKEFVSKDSRFTYYKKENTGLSDTRNYAIQYVTGEYILFLDSDDYIEPDLLKTLSNYNNYDLIKFNAKAVDESGNVLKYYRQNSFTFSDKISALTNIMNDDLIDPAWIYAYNKEFFIKNDFKYVYNKVHEDYGLTPFILLLANTIISIDYVGLNYVQREGSITNNNNIDKVKRKMNDVIWQYNNLINQINNANKEKNEKEIILIYVVDGLCRKYSTLPKELKKQYKKVLKKSKIYISLPSNNIKRIIKKYALMLNINLYLFLTKLGRK